MKTQEFAAKTVDDALTEASISLGLPSSEINYEVVSEGSRGFLGLASKDAVIKVLGDEDEPKVKENVSDSVEPEKAKDSNVKTKDDKTSNSEIKQEEVRSEKKVPLTADEIAANEEIIRTFLADVFKAMDLEVNVSITTDDDNMAVELSGDEMGVLIGKRGQTLDSLQYLTNLAVNRKNSRYIRVKIDTEDYRRRRKETLENLARNVAYKVKRNKRSVELEPMNPFERRIIHSALQDDKFVTTHSEGEEPYRHVVVTLKH